VYCFEVILPAFSTVNDELASRYLKRCKVFGAVAQLEISFIYAELSFILILQIFVIQIAGSFRPLITLFGGDSRQRNFPQLPEEVFSFPV
jgi:hypothetical protein